MYPFKHLRARIGNTWLGELGRCWLLGRARAEGGEGTNVHGDTERNQSIATVEELS